MGYKMDMSKESQKKPPLPEGWRPFKIIGCEEQVSKQGNEMFKFTFLDIETKQEEEVYAVAVQGKRWFLKSILAACDVPAAEDGVYEWDIPDVMDKAISGYVEHQEEEWINRKGETVTTIKGRITDTHKVDPAAIKAVTDEIPF